MINKSQIYTCKNQVYFTYLSHSLGILNFELIIVTFLNIVF